MRRQLTVGLVLTISVVALEALAVATVLPVAARDLGGVSQYGWAFSAFMLADLVGIVGAGREADRRGPASPFVAGLALFGLGLLVCGLAPDMTVVVAGRAIQGLGGGALSSLSYVVVARGFPEEERPRMLALLSTAWIVPGLVAPGVAGAVAQHLGWRYVFLGLVLAPAAAAVLALPGLRRLPPPPPAEASGSGPRVAQAARLALGAGVALGGLGAGPPLVAVPLVVVGVAVGLPALRALVPPGTLRARAGLPAAVAVRGLDTFAFFGAEAFLTLGLVTVRHLSATGVGLILTPATLSWAVGSWLQAHRAGRWSRRAMTVAGLGLNTVGIALAAATMLPSVPVGVAAVAWSLAGLGQGLAYSSLILVVLSESPPGAEGATTASAQLADVLGIALGTGVGGAVVAWSAAEGWPRRSAVAVTLGIALAVAAVGCLAARGLPGHAEPVDRAAAESG